MNKKEWPREENAVLAVRKNERGAYLDTGTASGALDVCRVRAAETDRDLERWAKDNPVVGFASCRIIVDDVFKA